MRFTHTVQFALGLNIRVIDDAGRPIAAFIAPVLILGLWLPGLLFRFLDRGLWRALDLQSKIRSHWLFDLAGWRRDLPLIWRAASSCNWPAGEVVYG